MGKASVSNVTVLLGLFVVPKALAMACLPVVASLLAIVPPTTSRVCPLAPYCPFPLLGWHPTAHHRLAPYCSLSAGTVLLIMGWHPTAHHRLAPYCSSSAGTLLLIISWHPTAHYQLAPYCQPPAGTLLLIAGWHPLSPLAPLAILSSPTVPPSLGYA